MSSENNNAYKDKIKEIIKEEFETDGIVETYRETNLVLYKIYKHTIIPKRKEQLKLMFEVETLNQELKQVDDRIIFKFSRYKSLQVKLRPWEREDDKTKHFLYFLNSLLDWILKSGLTFITVLVLFEIVGIFDLQNPLSLITKNGKIYAQNPAIIYTVFFVIFCSLSLVWLASAIIFNLVITNTKNLSNQSNQWWKHEVYLWIAVIWFSEVIIGWVTVPKLSNLMIKQAYPADYESLKLKWFGSFCIGLGIAIFALINALFAYAKGRVYLKNSKIKKYCAFLLELSKGLEKQKLRLEQQIEKKESQIEELNRYIYLDYDHDEIKKLDIYLSNDISGGEDRQGKHPKPNPNNS